jgi:hypothetical protein
MASSTSPALFSLPLVLPSSGTALNTVALPRALPRRSGTPCATRSCRDRTSSSSAPPVYSAASACAGDLEPANPTDPACAAHTHRRREQGRWRLTAMGQVRIVTLEVWHGATDNGP